MRVCIKYVRCIGDNLIEGSFRRLVDIGRQNTTQQIHGNRSF